MNYLMKYKGQYRLKAILDNNTNDFIRDDKGNIEDEDIYIDCQQGNKIFTYGHINHKKPVWLSAYIPSLGRGRNVKKSLDEKNIEYIMYKETDSEVLFVFPSKNIEIVAKLLKAKTSGAGISPFSVKNLPKSDVKIPTEEIERYKAISSRVEKDDLLIIYNITTSFMDSVMQKSIRKYKDSSFDYKIDIRKQCMARQTKEYIWTVGYWNEFLNYLSKEITLFYSKK